MIIKQIADMKAFTAANIVLALDSYLAYFSTALLVVLIT